MTTLVNKGLYESQNRISRCCRSLSLQICFIAIRPTYTHLIRKAEFLCIKITWLELLLFFYLPSLAQKLVSSWYSIITLADCITIHSWESDKCLVPPTSGYPGSHSDFGDLLFTLLAPFSPSTAITSFLQANYPQFPHLSYNSQFQTQSSKEIPNVPLFVCF